MLAEISADLRSERRVQAIVRRLAELAGMQIDRDPQGGAVCVSGRRASVYRLTSADGRVRALRLLPADGVERGPRYTAAGEYLQSRHVPWLVDFRYLPPHIGGDERSEGAALLMDWVPGVTLGERVGELARRGRAEGLVRLAGAWRDLVRGLAAHGVVHGDLEPDNVLVRPDGRLTLVDYDGLAVPSEMGRSNAEAGTMPFQHPRRNLQTVLHPGLDHFSALLIYTALRAPAADPSLYEACSVGRPNAPLLFQAEDFTSADDSPLFCRLFASPDATVRKLAHYLREVRRGDPEKVPSIDEALLWCDSLDDLLVRRDFDRAAELVARMGSQERIDPRRLPDIDDACRRTDCRRALAAAVETGVIAAIRRAYVPELLDDYPAAAAIVERARRALEIDRCLGLLRSTAEARQWPEFVPLWRTHAELLGGAAAAEPYRRLHDRLAAVDRLEALLDDPASDDRVIDDEQRSLLQDGEPPAFERLERARRRRAARRARYDRIIELIGVASRAPTFAVDQELRNRWKDAVQEGDARLVPLADHDRWAKRRMKRLRGLNELTHAPTLLGEQQIAACSRYLPQDYHPKLPGRILLAQRRLEAVRLLQAALLEPISERGLTAAADALIAAQGEPFLDAAQRERIELARRRVPLLDGLAACRDLPPAERDVRVLALWDETLPADGPDAAELRGLRDEARERMEAVARLRAALENSDPDEIGRRSADPRLADYSLPAELGPLLDAYRERLRQARLERRHALVRSVLDHDPDKFRTVFDRELAADLCARVPQHQRIVAAWTEREILPREKSGLSCGPADGPQWLGPGRCRLRWTWPPATVTERCRLTITRELPATRTISEDPASLYGLTVDRDPAQSDPPWVELEVPADWRGAMVSVRPVVDLGFQIFYGEPLALGQLRPPDQ